MRWTIVCLVALGTMASLTFAGDYCSLGASHTMCKYPGPSSSCQSKTIISGLTQAGKDNLLAEHNKLRRKVAKGNEAGQPAAANMRELKWDNELEQIAQRWADQCNFGHDKNRKMLDRTYVGQNAYYSGSSRQGNEGSLNDAGVKKAVQAWYNEVTKPGFNSANISPYKFSSGVGHYTQVVWAKTDRIGCGATYYKDGRWFKQLVICNYAVGGNMMRATMYETGAACSACPAGTSCNDGLCA